MTRSVAAFMAGLLVACAAAQPARQAVCLTYEPAEVTLTGRITLVQHFGPPNFGETPELDKRIDVPLLALSAPVDVCGDATSELNADTEVAVREVQLLGDDNVGERWNNQSVRISGTLSHAQTGYHFTKVLLTIQRIEPQ